MYERPVPSVKQVPKMFPNIPLTKCLMLLLFYTGISESQKFDCNKDEPCMPLRHCKEYMDFINVTKNLHRHFIKFLIDKQCGFYKEEPKVCCGKIPPALKYVILASINRPHNRYKRSAKSTDNDQLDQLNLDESLYYTSDINQTEDLLRLTRETGVMENIGRLDIR
ncbi:uncharacterized protein LOC123683153 [Harmonia axyridis]|uniref:uncharacterized protein LOC123683153 n=1 Tax=Harmonia axyridis TaxID=115357 RepID=UPI001E279485|nr:uncharacterized protein LOC123683153 [Harmonia axyridis]